MVKGIIKSKIPHDNLNKTQRVIKLTIYINDSNSL